MRIARLLLACVVSGLTVSSIPAQNTAQRPPASEDPRLDPPRIKLEGDPVEMSLADVIMATFERNLELETRQLDVEASQGLLTTQRGIYDPELNASVTRTRIESENTSVNFTDGSNGGGTNSGTLNPSEDDREIERYALAINQLIPTGGLLTVGTERQVTDNNNFTGSGLNPVDENRVFARFTQPLLKNFGPKVTNFGINAAKLEEKIRRALYQQELETRLAEVMTSYWNLVFAIRNLEVQRTSLEAAIELERVNDLRVQTGTAPRSDLFQAQARVAERVSNVITAKSLILAAQDRMLAVMNWSEPANAWNRPILPQDKPTTYSLEMELNEEALVEEAFIYRNDIDALRFAQEIAELSRDVLAWQRLPELNLILEYGLSGWGESRSDSWDDINDSRYSDYTYGVEFRYPLLNRRARGEYATSKAEFEQARVDVDRLELAIVTQVRAATRQVRQAQESIIATEAQVKAAEETLFAEQKRLEVGSSTTFNVLEFQEDLAQALVNQVQAQVSYQQGLIELARSRGRLLEFIGNEVDVTFLFDESVEELQ